jgi:hypothetical protein
LVLALFVFATAARAQESFKTAEEALNALVNAARAEDRDGVLAILGPDGEDIVSSGDAVADAAALKRSSPPMTPSTRSPWRATARPP